MKISRGIFSVVFHDGLLRPSSMHLQTGRFYWLWLPPVLTLQRVRHCFDIQFNCRFLFGLLSTIFLRDEIERFRPLLLILWFLDTIVRGMKLIVRGNYLILKYVCIDIEFLIKNLFQIFQDEWCYSIYWNRSLIIFNEKISIQNYFNTVPLFLFNNFPRDNVDHIFDSSYLFKEYWHLAWKIHAKYFWISTTFFRIFKRNETKHSVNFRYLLNINSLRKSIYIL